MSEWHLIKPSPRFVFFAFFILPQMVVADLEAPALQYIARRLLPNECQIVVNREASDPFNVPPQQKPYKLPSSGIDCFRKLVGWTSNLRVNRIDAQLLLGDRLRQIGRNDLAAWLLGPNSRVQETIEYDSWNSKKNSNLKLPSSSLPTVSKISRMMFGLPGMKNPGLSPDLRRLDGIHNVNSLKDRNSVMVEPESVHPETSAPQYATAEPAAHQQDLPGASSSPISNTSEAAVSGKTPEGGKFDKLKLPLGLPQISDEKAAPCLRVPLVTALVVISTIMALTCCCALLLRNRLAACFERLRGKKPKTSKRMSTDEEQGFMGPKTVGKPPKRSGRKGGGPVDVANVGVQNNNGASNAVLESDEKLVGCCNCCARKKKKNRRKWKK